MVVRLKPCCVHARCRPFNTISRKHVVQPGNHSKKRFEIERSPSLSQSDISLVHIDPSLCYVPPPNILFRQEIHHIQEIRFFQSWHLTENWNVINLLAHVHPASHIKWMQVHSFPVEASNEGHIRLCELNKLLHWEKWFCQPWFAGFDSPVLCF